MSDDFTFDGFTIPEKNYFPMPNEWVDICAKIDNLSELKIIQYVLRHTWGYREYGITKTISVDEFMNGRRRVDRSRMDSGTGLSEPSVKDGIKRAIKHGYLVCDVDEKDLGRTKKSYGLKMIEERGKILTPQDTYPVSSLPPGVKILTPWGKDTYPRSEKDTNRKTPEEKQIEREEVADATAPAASSSFHFPQNDEERQQYNTFMRGARIEVSKANKGTRHKTIKATISKRTPAKKETPPAISAEAIRIMDAWDSIFSRKCTRTENHIKAAELLVPCAPTRDDLSNIRKFCYKSNPKWYNDKGVSLIDVAKNFDKWQSLQEAPQVSENNGHSPPGNNGKMDYNAAIFDTSQNFIKGTEEELAEVERQLAERKKARMEAKR